MERRQIQRLAAADLQPESFRELAEHGEDLLVERKAQLPTAEKLGAEVASMANMLGGWLLLGVDDETRQFEELALPKGVDLQSHIGHLLRNAVDPVPPYLAGILEVDEKSVGFVRVFRASVPVLVKGKGAIYSRDDGGKVPIADHRVLLELARSGRDAEQEAGQRPNQNALTQEVLGLPPEKHSITEYHMRTIVRAAPLTVTPQLSEWPVSKGSAECFATAEWLAAQIDVPHGFTTQLRPFGRAVAGYAAPLSLPPLPLYQAVVVADCAGIFGVAASRQAPNVLKTHELRRNHIRPEIEAIVHMLGEAEAFGDVVFDLHLVQSREVALVGEQGNFQGHALPRTTHCGSAILSIPADEEDRAELAKRWEREVGRTAGIALWES